MDVKLAAGLWLSNMLGLPYKWGGDNPIEGMDCSGFAIEFLNSFYGPIGDTTADGLKNIFSSNRTGIVKFGTLLFFGKDGRATHVAIAIDVNYMFEAGGGGRNTKTVDDAAAQGAFIRIRPVSSRSDLIGAYHPEYRWD